MNDSRLRKIYKEKAGRDWDEEGRKAGILRNIKMLNKYPDSIVIAFEGGVGTNHCVTHARTLQMRVIDTRS